MHWAERKYNSHRTDDTMSRKTLDQLNGWSALKIGLLQCVAMWPGTSRSMMTIVGGYLVGLSRPLAAEFSFLLGLVTLTAAAVYKYAMNWEVMHKSLSIGPAILGCLIAGVSAAVSVRWLVHYLSSRGLTLFVWYRIVLAMVLLFLHFYQI